MPLNLKHEIPEILAASDTLPVAVMLSEAKHLLCVAELELRFFASLRMTRFVQ
jgi:hypothetical protein